MAFIQENPGKMVQKKHSLTSYLCDETKHQLNNEDATDHSWWNNNTNHITAILQVNLHQSAPLIKNWRILLMKKIEAINWISYAWYYSTSIINLILDLILNFRLKGKKLYFGFVDLEKAFDW